MSVPRQDISAHLERTCDVCIRLQPDTGVYSAVVARKARQVNAGRVCKVSLRRRVGTNHERRSISSHNWNIVDVLFKSRHALC